MTEDNRHVLQAAEEKMERMSAELGRVRNELDRYSRDLVEKERECDKLRKSVAKDETGMTYSSYDAAAISRVIDERDAYRKALKDIVAIDNSDASDCCDVDHYGGIKMQEIAEQALGKEEL